MLAPSRQPAPRKPTRQALFLDRDGTLIVDVGYPNDPAQVVLIEGAAQALVELSQDYSLVIVTNQSGIARGKITLAQAAAVAARTAELFAAHGVTFAGSQMCPHGPAQHGEPGCPCRKPAPGMLLAAAAELELELAASVMVGDRESDRLAGVNAGCRASLVLGSAEVPDWPAVVALVRGLPRLASQGFGDGCA